MGLPDRRPVLRRGHPDLRWVLCCMAFLALLGALTGRTDEDADVSSDKRPPTMTSPSVVLASDIPVAHTPAGGYGDSFPDPVLTTCTEPLVEGAPDLRGMWRAVGVERNGQSEPLDDKLARHIQRIEQCGNRLIVTAGGVVHDMRVDGTEENGVRDVAERDFTTPITVVATFENGVHVLRPVGIPVEVTRQLDGDQLIWTYLGRRITLDRIGGPNDPPPALD